MTKVYDADWFARPTVVVAADLIGAVLCRRLPSGEVLRAVITETEAYIGAHDPACHAHLHRRTSRTAPMFEQGGIFYVYLIYGLHHMLNVVTGDAGAPEAVLIRAAIMDDDPRRLAGPAKLTQTLGIDKTLNTQAVSPQSGVWIEVKTMQPQVSVRPRIGIDYAGEAKHWLLRYVWSGHPSLSKP